MRKLSKEYYDWLVRMIDIQEHFEYSSLLRALHSREFFWSVPMDKNRAIDGEYLRRRFARECNKSLRYIEDTFTDPCSVLEMMIGLAVRCEEHIMHDPAYGDRTSIWFWEMISNLNLLEQTDDVFNHEIVDTIIDRLLERSYSRDGSGGLFTVNKDVDMRRTEIWYQLNYYLNELEENRI